ncbi:cell division protein ZapA [Octadecabacter sp. 1_MG-2023]|uniref:cell division protein ZapA n=1 Tax=unclassified Octadecabacter TaxID=196158 RepID=UPI001C0835D8|nr:MULTISPECIES: cell division protein ZapA [unclassified Octadecabacter]MBU2993467.1 cell division protein ZapA [Octadecabacter sp. B2R22]MDO6733077.1 cell division protein ZapA [Octadecabacter sp. 1_MG-2023]
MPQVEITIGGRSFEVACQEGEEQFLMTAAAMLDVEASSLSTQIGRMPESRMLLMAGLLLADRTAGLEDKVREAEGKLAQVQAQLESKGTTTERVEVPVVPAETVESLTELARQAEYLAEEIEGRSA